MVLNQGFDLHLAGHCDVALKIVLKALYFILHLTLKQRLI